MEAKKILRIVKDDIADLEGISSDFNQELLPSPDEIELALVKTRAVLTALEWLRKYTALQQIDFGKSASLDLSVSDIPADANVVQEDVVLQEPVSSDQFTSTPEKKEAYPSDTDRLYEEDYSAQNGDVLIEKEVVSHEATNELNDTADQVVSHEVEEVDDVNEKCTTEGERTLGESLNGLSKTVNDLLSNGKEEVEFQTTPILSIWDGIGINDRFLYIRELFAGDSDKFENSINALDQSETINDAVNYLKMNFVWNKSETSQKFLSLIKRRFTI